MRGTFYLIAVLGLLIVADSASAVSVRVSIGVRETGTAAAVGGNGGAIGPIEWIRLDQLSLPLDGQFHTFTFNFGSDPVAAFTGNGVLNGTRGTLEHIRIRNFDGITVPIQLHIDNIRNTTAAGVQMVSDFEGFAAGSEVTFQEPRFSSSTVDNLAISPNSAATTSATASEGTSSLGVNFRFVDATPTRWLRLTTFDATNLPNPAIDFSPGNSLSIDIKGVAIPEPAIATGLLGTALLALRRRAR